MSIVKKVIKFLGIILLLFAVFNLSKIYKYSFNYSEKKSDVAIILGAGTNNGILSPVFLERINHGVYLYKKGIIEKIILTGGKGENQLISDSQIGKIYATKEGVPAEDILIEERSRNTYENLTEAKFIMDRINFSNALIVSDPLHMKRAMELGNSLGIECAASPTKTSMYKTAIPKLKSLWYETFFYTLGKLTFVH